MVNVSTVNIPYVEHVGWESLQEYLHTFYLKGGMTGPQKSTPKTVHLSR